MATAANYTNLADPGVIGSFYEALDSEFSTSWASQLGWLNSNSNQELETYAWLGSVPKFREWLGGRAATRPRAESYTIRNKLWEQTLEFSLDDLRRDKFGQIQTRINELAASGAAFWEDIVTSLINTDGLDYSGQNFFDTDKPVLHSTTGSTTAVNDCTNSHISTLNVGTASAPTSDEAALAIQGIVGQMMTFKDDQGHLVNSNMKSVTFMTATPTIWAPVLTAIGQANLTAGASNPVNGLKSMGMSFNVILNPNLTVGSSDTLYAFRTDRQLKPFILQEEEGVKVNVVGAGSEEEFKNRRHLFGTERIGNGGYGLWYYALKATLS